MLDGILCMTFMFMFLTFVFSLEYEDYRDRLVFLAGAVFFLLLLYLAVWLFGGEL